MAKPASAERSLSNGAAALFALALVGQAALPGAAAGFSAAGAFEICEEQQYALCAAASCFVFEKVAYCKCDIEFGDSLSLADDYDGGDVCSLNEEGASNGYMVSTYSLPDSVLKGGDGALYTCTAKDSDGAYAQCDGGLCFDSTIGNSFPSFGQLASDEIICSCPITVANPQKAKVGYQIFGPYPCQQDYFDNCRRTTANKQNGATIHVGAPTGIPRFLTRRLDGSVPPLNHCKPSR
ncbi:MAG: hypothetical protein FJ144_25020 [Deltaproteobacteria bacterium]|nr:hypothetical protein [Deltaproteobacteria bacterium]